MKSQSPQIKKGIPLPGSDRHALHDLLPKMTAGDCVDFPMLDKKNINAARSTITAIAARKGAKIATRVCKNGEGLVLRVWRVS